MKKIYFLLLVALCNVVHISAVTKPSWGTTPDWWSKEFVFINKVPHQIRIDLFRYNNPGDLLFPVRLAKIVLQPNELQRIKLAQCVHSVQLYLGPGSMFAGMPTGNFKTLWGRVPGKCSGVGEITQKNGAYKFKWLK